MNWTLAALANAYRQMQDCLIELGTLSDPPARCGMETSLGGRNEDATASIIAVSYGPSGEVSVELDLALYQCIATEGLRAELTMNLTGFSEDQILLRTWDDVEILRAEELPDALASMLTPALPLFRLKALELARGVIPAHEST